MCSTTLMEVSPSDELPRPPHFLLNNNNNNNNISKPLVVGMAPASPDDSSAGDDRVAPLSPDSPGARSIREDDDDEISVGCPSPQTQVRDDTMSEDEEEYLHRQRHYRSGSSSPEHRLEDDYFKPLKKLKMMQINKQRKLRRQSASPPALSLPIPIPAPPPPPPPAFDSESTPTSGTSPTGVKSFSIMDILNHRPRPAHSPVPPSPVPMAPSAMHRVDAAHAVGLMLQSPAMLAAAASAAASRIVRPWDFGGMLDPAIMMERLHQQQQTLRRHQQHVQHVQQQHLHLQQQAAAHHQAQQALSLSRPQSADLSSSACSSGRSSTASDCCSPSPDVRRQQQQQQQGKDGNSPLDALFQMTSKTFDGLNGEQAAEGSGSHLNLFNSRQQPKKKRKSRTAFTNHQIFELEKRFLYQKYLSPADRDEIAAGLGLSNAQVITWFQNRRAKLKRDMEELKKDVESAKVLTAHKSFLEKVHSLGVLKKKAQPQEKPPVPEK